MLIVVQIIIFMKSIIFIEFLNNCYCCLLAFKSSKGFPKLLKYQESKNSMRSNL